MKDCIKNILKTQSLSGVIEDKKWVSNIMDFLRKAGKSRKLRKKKVVRVTRMNKAAKAARTLKKIYKWPRRRASKYARVFAEPPVMR